ncbi:MAG: pyridoxamine 5'-phosphate oxidase family protein [Clostridiales bacterium]|nr:pyridoxamine 5'-phosphate oxidase family protein [Clostridiales bacterium]
MKRKDREITDRQAIIDIIENCQCCRIGFQDDGEVYIVPLNFGFEYSEQHITFYFHGANDGRKIDLIAKNPHVGFEMDTNHEVYAKSNNGTACTYTARFQSVIGTGKVSMVCNVEEKKHGLLLLMKHTTQKCEWSFDEKMLNAVAVFKLEVEKLSCKEHE